MAKNNINDFALTNGAAYTNFGNNNRKSSIYISRNPYHTPNNQCGSGFNNYCTDAKH